MTLLVIIREHVLIKLLSYVYVIVRILRGLRMSGGEGVAPMGSVGSNISRFSVVFSFLASVW